MRKCEISPDASCSPRVLPIFQSRSDCKKAELCYCTFLVMFGISGNILTFRSTKETVHLPGREGGCSAWDSKVSQLELGRAEGLFLEVQLTQQRCSHFYTGPLLSLYILGLDKGAFCT